LTLPFVAALPLAGWPDSLLFERGFCGGQKLRRK
jgi:hypothetical protein